MVQFQLQFRNLILEDFKKDEESDDHVSVSNPEDDKLPTQIAIAFDKGHIPHAFHQAKSSVHVKGAFLLCLPLGEYPKMGSYEEARLEAIVKRMALEYLPLDNEPSFQKLSLYPPSEFLLLAPSLKRSKKKTELFLRTAFALWSMNDFFTRTLSSSMPLLTGQTFSDFERFLTNIMTGLYRTTDAIPNTEIKFMNKILEVWFRIYEDLKGQPGYEEFHKYFLDALLNWIRYYKICGVYMGCNWEPANQPYSAIKNLSGRKVMLELIQLLTGSYVDDPIRDHVLFHLFRESVDLVCNLVYEIVSLHLHNLPGETGGKAGRFLGRNALLSEIVRNELSFEAALEQHLLVINNEILDLKYFAKGLAQEFHGIQEVENYVKNALLYVDGTIRYLLLQERYGKCECKLMKVVKIVQA